MSSMYRALAAFAAVSICACATGPRPALREGQSASSAVLDAEARAIEAAKRHPNAQPRVRPLYPEKAPPPLPPGTKLPPPIYVTRRAPSPYAHDSLNDFVTTERLVYTAAPNPYGPSYRYGYGVGFGAYPVFGAFGSSYGFGPSPYFSYGFGGYPFYPSGYSYRLRTPWRGPRFSSHRGFGHMPAFTGHHAGGPMYHSGMSHWGGGFRGSHPLHIRSVNANFSGHHHH